MQAHQSPESSFVRLKISFDPSQGFFPDCGTARPCDSAAFSVLKDNLFSEVLFVRPIQYNGIIHFRVLFSLHVVEIDFNYIRI